jgi:hypothetical protein
MKRTRLPLLRLQLVSFCCFCLATITSLSCHSAQVYKWVDENGKTHFSHKPHDEKSETIQIRKNPALDPEHDARIKKQKRLLKVLDEERQESKQNKTAKAEEKRKRESNCKKAREKLQGIKNASFLYDETDDPENPAVYSNEKRRKATTEAEKSVHKWCA